MGNKLILDPSQDYNFITDRLAIGSLASRAVPGWAAVVSVVTVEGRHRGRPWSAELTEKAPQVVGGVWVRRAWSDLSGEHEWFIGNSWDNPSDDQVPVLVVDIADGESSTDRTAYSCPHVDDRDLDFYLDDATQFIADHITKGPVLVHCGAGVSRSAAVVVAYLCRYAGMSYSEALAFVKARRPQVAPADCFAEAVKRWLKLDEMATKGPRG